MSPPSLSAPRDLAGVLGSLSVATDLANGNPLETALKCAVSAVALARAAGASLPERGDVFWASVLRFIGCTAYAHEEARALGGDDIATRSLFAPLDVRRRLEYLPAAARGVAKGAGAGARGRALLKVLTVGPSLYQGMAATHCEVAVRLAERLRMPAGVLRALSQLYERWDGRGEPARVGGKNLSLPARVLHVAYAAELQHRQRGAAAALKILRQRAGSQLDPELVRAFVAEAPSHFETFCLPSAWDVFLDLAPASAPSPTLDTIATAFGDFVDLKSVYTLGHSPGVAQLALAAAEVADLPREERETLRCAAYLHDLGRVSVPTGIWEKRTPLTSSEWERVRLHPYYGECALMKSPLLAPLAPWVGAHHERADGSGYFRGTRAAALPFGARVLAAADTYQALTELRPHRPGRTRDEAARALRESTPGQLDRDAVDAVLQAAGHPRLPPRKWPAGLTEREVEVLRLLVRGNSNKQIAAALRISHKTVQHHVMHVYAKASVSTRAGAALFAIENELATTGG